MKAVDLKQGDTLNVNSYVYTITEIRHIFKGNEWVGENVAARREDGKLLMVEFDREDMVPTIWISTH